MTKAVMQPISGSSRAALAGILALPCAALASPASAQRDVTDRNPDVADVALTPLSDLNLARDPIPPILIWARDNPYYNDGLEDCRNIRRGIGDLDAVLGDDVDTQDPERRRLTPEGVAQSAIGMFIPFRGIIREISGANSHEYQFRQAIAAGLMRRAYLKGLGEARGCAYPARPMPPAMLSDLEEDGRLEIVEPDDGEFVAADGTRYRSRPVVQPTD